MRRTWGARTVSAGALGRLPVCVDCGDPDLWSVGWLALHDENDESRVGRAELEPAPAER